MMNRFVSIFATLLLVCLSFVPSGAQQRLGMTHMTYNDSSAICLKNNYMVNKDVNYQPYDIRLPFRDQHYVVYGRQLDILAFRMEELLSNGGWSVSGSFRDTLPEDAHIFKLETMEFCFRRNGVLEMDWSKVKAAPPYIDTYQVRVMGQPASTFHRQSLLLYRTFLQNGDSAILSFRHNGAAPFLTAHFKKEDPQETPPRLMFRRDVDNGTLTIEDFVKDMFSGGALTKRAMGDGDDFYAEWPGAAEYGRVTRLLPGTRAAFVFSGRKDIPNDSAFEYRLLAGSHREGSWRKSNNVIFVSGFEAGNEYRLEVRYADKPHLVCAQRFYVPGYWYQQWWFRIAAAVCLLLPAGLLFLFFRNRRQRALQAAHLSRVRALYTQLNPHFIFNALGSIQGLLNEGEQKKANMYLSGFGSLLRHTLHSSEKSMTDLGEELEHLQRYINLEQLRRPFTYALSVEPGLHPVNIEMLPLFFQPVVENAIKHGWRGKDNVLTLTITVGARGNDLLVHIRDDGKGFDTTQRHRGKGLQLTYERIALFNQMHHGKKIEADLQSDGTGTSFHCKFINWLDD
ncbi:hypothetical protein EGT74_05925 [Chitinophaga lutea]|uniref:Signal transduction histidine kinase internal region domain-containing protein n=1 Tax=Chitinophaga lutea TaxID=2488634 RepID=A0A3N4Q6B3_9BACT|nr:histidine kinase [Chitinophaga lutea]RPE13071.1 hypothetical protein EGT74_05925 [Chitinophaga lutea]